MAGDERRAEVEAAVSERRWVKARLLSAGFDAAEVETMATALDRLRDARGDIWDTSDERGRLLDTIGRLEGELAVRDARGDDEGRRARYPKMLHGEAATAARHAEHARSPQDEGRDGTVAVERVMRWALEDLRAGDAESASLRLAGLVGGIPPSPIAPRDGTVAVEDEEEREFDEQAITDILVGIDEVLESHGRERMDIIDGPTVDDLRDVVKRGLAEFARSATGEQTDHGGDQ